ncbi:MAG: ATP-binding cassette domain-containing protein [Dermatophilaceae bacterium]
MSSPPTSSPTTVLPVADPVPGPADGLVSGPVSELAVEARGLVKTFGHQRAVDGVDLEVRRGEVFGVLGPNGAGKTTVLRMLATLLPIDAGEARLLGVDVRREPHVVRQLLGVTGQYASVDELLTATENLVLFGRLQGLSRAAARTTATGLLEEFDLVDAADKPLRQFSGGMRRRLDLAASLITRPPVVFLDEPTTGLDPRTRGQMWETVRDLVRGGSTVLLTTQYLDEADQLADRVAVIDRGRVVALGTPDELKSSVGRSSLQVGLEDPADAATAVDAVTRLGGEAPVVDSGARSGGCRLTLALDRSDTAVDALVALRDAGVATTSVTVATPSLDEVFLALTGHDTDGHDTDGHDTDGHDTGSHDTGSHDTGSHDTGSHDTGSHDTDHTGRGTYRGRPDTDRPDHSEETRR